jgi:hypothetical protein
MRQFLQHHAGNILGVLSGFDRWRLRGGLRMFGSENGVVGWLQNAGIALKDFLTWAKDKTNQLRRRTERDAEAAGRPVEYLKGFLDKEDHVAKIYVRRDNCFIEIADMERAQKLLDDQPRQEWRGQLNRLLRRVHALHTEIFKASPLDYYWTSDQTEWATDVLFHDPAVLEDLYRTLVRRGIDTFQSSDVLRFLGHKMPAHGGVNGNYKGRVQSDMKRRAEGIRLKHRAGSNSVKMYNKQPTVLRVETTLNNTRDLKSYRRKQNDPKGKPAWRSLRKSVADLGRRAQLSQASNARYLEALSTIVSETPLSRLTDKLCRPVQIEKRRYRALRPFDPDDAKLLELVSRGETLITGFRNRDIREAFYGPTADECERRRQAARVTRRFAILRAHGLIKKIPHTHRYVLTHDGVTAITALLAARKAPLARLTAA